MAALGIPIKVCGRRVKVLSMREHESVQCETILKKKKRKDFNVTKCAYKTNIALKR